jgi:hypothetical protein
MAGVALAALLVSCSSDSVDTATVRESLREDYLERTGAEVENVDCPDEVPRDLGTSFVCTLEVDGQTLEVVATQTDGDGTIGFSQKQALIEVGAVIAGIQEYAQSELRVSVTVDCGRRAVAVVDLGGTFDCTATDENGTAVVIRVTAGGSIEEPTATFDLA